MVRVGILQELLFFYSLSVEWLEKIGFFVDFLK